MLKSTPAKLIFVFLLLLPLVIASLNRPMTDYGVFISAIRAKLAGETRLYDVQNLFYYAPWAVPFIVPFALLPDRVGQAIYNTLSLAALVWATWTLAKPLPWWALAIALTNLYAGMLILIGQWDGFMLAALALAWIAIERRNPWLLGLALVGMTTKPTHVILGMLLLLWKIRLWPRPLQVKVFILPLIAVLSSFFIVGIDWPVRFVRFVANNPNPAFFYFALITPWGDVTYITSLWKHFTPPIQILLAAAISIAVFILLRGIRRNGIERETLRLTLVILLVSIPYLLPYQFIYALPEAADLLRRRLGLGLVLTIAALLDLLFLRLGIGILLFPILALLVASISRLIEPPPLPAPTS
jgi:hypothetical protein